MAVEPSAFVRQWYLADPDGLERRQFNRMSILLTPIAHIEDDTFHAGVLAAMEARAGRIHTGYDNTGALTYLEFTDS